MSVRSDSGNAQNEAGGKVGHTTGPPPTDPVLGLLGVPPTRGPPPEVEEWVFDALCDPWVTNPDVLLKAVNSTRTMPRVESAHEQYTRWMEEGLIYPVLRPSTASAKDAALSRQNSASSACNRAHLLKRSESLKFPPSRAGARGGGGGERGGKDLESKLVLQRDRPSSARPVPGSMRTLKRSSSLRPTSTSKRGDGEGTALARVTRQPSVRPPSELLRQMFIDQALSYIGTPYIRSSASLGKASCRQLPSRLKTAAPVPGAHDKWNLALDCSGLVRQCLVDLQRYFGFCVGGWNQAYQFDTLPIEVSSIQGLAPGDLIFISGKYFDETRTAKPHDMTHVEIYFPFKSRGSTQTIGSRHRHGCVQVHPDFRFESKTYYDMQYHFRSIETWLQGTCTSHLAHLHIASKSSLTSTGFSVGFDRLHPGSQQSCVVFP